VDLAQELNIDKNFLDIVRINNLTLNFMGVIMEKKKELEKWKNAISLSSVLINHIDNLANELSIKNDYCHNYGCDKCPLTLNGTSCTSPNHPASKAVEHLNLAIINMKEFSNLISEDMKNEGT